MTGVTGTERPRLSGVRACRPVCDSDTGAPADAPPGRIQTGSLRETARRRPLAARTDSQERLMARSRCPSLQHSPLRSRDHQLAEGIDRYVQAQELFEDAGEQVHARPDVSTLVELQRC